MKRMFKSITSLLLTLALLLTPCFSTTSFAAEEGVNEGNISSENINTETEVINTSYSYGNYIEPDAVIPNPDYISSEGNSQIQGATNSTSSTTSATSERLADGIYWINNLHNGKYLDTLKFAEADKSIRNNVNFKDCLSYTVSSINRYLAGSGDIAPCN